MRVLAHRGLRLDRFDENSREALQFALDQGVTYLEIDIRASSDGFAFVLHDRDLKRVAGVARRVSAFTAAELDALNMHLGSHPLRLSEALHLFPTARFNIDIKSADAIDAVRRDIANDLDRLLLTSFSECRRRRTVAKLNVATSGSALTTLLARALQKNSWLLGLALRRVDALQIPVKRAGLRFDSESFIRAVKKHGVEVHFWVINDVDQAKRLVARGANGIVTDRADLMAAAFAE